jgi:hypothetical protein
MPIILSNNRNIRRGEKKSKVTAKLAESDSSEVLKLRKQMSQIIGSYENQLKLHEERYNDMMEEASGIKNIVDVVEKKVAEQKEQYDCNIETLKNKADEIENKITSIPTSDDLPAVKPKLKRQKAKEEKPKKSKTLDTNKRWH